MRLPANTFIKPIVPTWTNHLSTNWTLPILAVLATLIVRWRADPHHDVTALTTWAERVVDGARPYIDFIEVNPPGSFLLYVPSVLLGRAFGFQPELATEILLLAMIAGSLAMCWRILAPSLASDLHHKPLALAGAILVLGALPISVFGQREHFGVILLLPIFAVTASALAGHLPDQGMRAAAGIGAALAIVAKPYFVVPLAFVFLWRIIAARSLRPVLHTEWLATAAGALAYIGFCWVAYPTFFSKVMPEVAETYLPVRDLGSCLRRIILPFFFVLAAALMIAGRLAQSASKVLMLAAAGSVLTYFLQGKGWPYHLYPMVAFLLLAAIVEVTRRLDGQPSVSIAGKVLSANDRRSSIAAFAVLVFAIGCGTFVNDNPRDFRTIAQFVKKTHPNPTMAMISYDVSIGHPLVRLVGGKWVQSVGGLMATYGAQWQMEHLELSPARRARLQALEEADALRLARDLEEAAPDIVLVDRAWYFDGLKWAKSFPSLVHQIEKYEDVGRLENVTILARKSRQ